MSLSNSTKSSSILPAAARRLSKPSVSSSGHVQQPLAMSQNHDLQMLVEMDTKANRKSLKIMEKGRLESVGVLFVQFLKVTLDSGSTFSETGIGERQFGLRPPTDSFFCAWRWRLLRLCLVVSASLHFLCLLVISVLPNSSVGSYEPCLLEWLKRQLRQLHRLCVSVLAQYISCSTFLYSLISMPVALCQSITLV